MNPLAYIRAKKEKFKDYRSANIRRRMEERNKQLAKEIARQEKLNQTAKDTESLARQKAKLEQANKQAMAQAGMSKKARFKQVGAGIVKAFRAVESVGSGAKSAGGFKGLDFGSSKAGSSPFNSGARPLDFGANTKKPEPVKKPKNIVIKIPQ